MSAPWVVLALLLWTTVAAAQEPSPPAGAGVGTPAFRSGVDLVALNVVVTDESGRFVPGLPAEAFAVFEDGVQQDLSFFAATAVPLDLAILLDTSASMTEKLETAQQAAGGFLDALRPGDRVTIVDIKDATRVLRPLTGDVESARRAIAATVARGGTALYNGIYTTLKELAREQLAATEVRRQAIVVLSDGEDTGSLVSFDDVRAASRETGVAI